MDAPKNDCTTKWVDQTPNLDSTATAMRSGCRAIDTCRHPATSGCLPHLPPEWGIEVSKNIRRGKECSRRSKSMSPREKLGSLTWNTARAETTEQQKELPDSAQAQLYRSALGAPGASAPVVHAELALPRCGLATLCPVDFPREPQKGTLSLQETKTHSSRNTQICANQTGNTLPPRHKNTHYLHTHYLSLFLQEENKHST